MNLVKKVAYVTCSAIALLPVFSSAFASSGTEMQTVSVLAGDNSNENIYFSVEENVSDDGSADCYGSDSASGTIEQTYKEGESPSLDRADYDISSDDSELNDSYSSLWCDCDSNCFSEESEENDEHVGLELIRESIFEDISEPNSLAEEYMREYSRSSSMNSFDYIMLKSLRRLYPKWFLYEYRDALGLTGRTDFPRGNRMSIQNYLDHINTICYYFHDRGEDFTIFKAVLKLIDITIRKQPVKKIINLNDTSANNYNRYHSMVKNLHMFCNKFWEPVKDAFFLNPLTSSGRDKMRGIKTLKNMVMPYRSEIQYPNYYKRNDFSTFSTVIK